MNYILLQKFILLLTLLNISTYKITWHMRVNWQNCLSLTSVIWTAQVSVACVGPGAVACACIFKSLINTFIKPLSRFIIIITFLVQTQRPVQGNQPAYITLATRQTSDNLTTGTEENAGEHVVNKNDWITRHNLGKNWGIDNSSDTLATKWI